MFQSKNPESFEKDWYMKAPVIIVAERNRYIYSSSWRAPKHLGLPI